MNNLIGQTINRYRILEVLGEGGMGAVLKGFDNTLQREVAIKVMHTHFARQAGLRERFLQEARTAARLDHASIVKVYDFGEEGSILFIVMEMIPGKNLQEMLDDLKKKGKQVDLKESVYLVKQISNAIFYAHKHGVLHRDIKPANVMIKPDSEFPFGYRPVLTDLGLAKILEASSMTQTGISMGTPSYMSPEQAMGQTLDARSDVYSLGILAFELCAGKLPFPARTISEAIRYHTKEKPPSPRSIKPEIPERVETVILKAIEKQPGDRFQDAQSFALAMENSTKIVESVQTVGDVSLLTQHEIRMTEQKPAEKMTGRPQMGKNSIQVKIKDQYTQTYEINKETITIGRTSENDIAIDDLKVSRKHARIEFDGKKFVIIDLESTNGTFIDDVKLLPGINEPWHPEKLLRIGNAWLKLNVLSVVSQPVYTEAGTSLDTNDQMRYGSNQRVNAVLQPQKIQVEPGSSSSVTAILINQGSLVDHFNVTLKGIPREWLPTPVQNIQLMPGMQNQVQLTIMPPKTSQSKAGNYSLTLEVVSEVAPDEISRAFGTLEVKPFYDYTLSLYPQRKQGFGFGEFNPLIRNNGNAQLSVRFEAHDPEGFCQFRFDPYPLKVPAGEERSVEMKVSSGIPLQEGQTKLYSFDLQSRPDEASDLVKQTRGEWMQIPLSINLNLYPEEQEGIYKGEFKLELENKSQNHLTVQLSGRNVQSNCNFQFSNNQLTIPALSKKSVQLTVIPRSGYKIGTKQIHKFEISSVFPDQGNVSEVVQGQWTQMYPKFDVSVDPSIIEAKGETAVKLQVNNKSGDTLALSFNLVSPVEYMQADFNPPSAQLAKDQSIEVYCRLVPKSRNYSAETKLIPVSIGAHVSNDRQSLKTAALEYKQLISEKSGAPFLGWLVLTAGWGVAWLFSSILFNSSMASLLMDFLSGSGAPSDMFYMFISMLQGLFFGGLGGMFTGFGLKIAHPGIKGQKVLWTAVFWGLVWAVVNGPIIYILGS